MGGGGLLRLGVHGTEPLGEGGLEVGAAPPAWGLGRPGCKGSGGDPMACSMEGVFPCELELQLDGARGCSCSTGS